MAAFDQTATVEIPAVDKTMKNRQRTMFMDLLNLVACIAVVGLHVSLNVFGPERSLNWLQAEVLQAFGIFAVPVFFMISGANLLGYRERYSTAVFFKKRVWRVGRALLLGSIVCYLLYSMFPSSFYGAGSFTTPSVRDFLKRTLTNTVNDTYWFFFSVIGLYMLVPMLSWMAGRCRTVEYAMMVCLTVSVVIPFAMWAGVPSSAFATLFDWPTFSTPLFYFLAGWWMVTWKPFRDVHPMALLAAFLLSSVGMLVAGVMANGWWMPAMAGSYDSTLVSIGSPLCVAQSLSLFALGQQLEPWLRKQSDKVRDVLNVLSGLTLGVYLFHVPVINWMGVHTMPAVFKFEPLRMIVVYAVAAVMVWVGKQLIAGVRKLTGIGR